MLTPLSSFSVWGLLLWHALGFLTLGAVSNPSSVQSLSHVQLFVTLWTVARQICLSITNSQSFLKLLSIKSVMPSNCLILCCPLLLLPLILPSIRVFSNESVLGIRRPKYWSFSFSINPSNEYSRLISFRIDWFDFLAVQGTLRSLLQCHSSKASILWCSVFFTVLLSHPYMTTGKQILIHIKKQRNFFIDKGLSSQSYGFSSSHVWMWELAHKDDWVPKNWCF